MNDRSSALTGPDNSDLLGLVVIPVRRWASNVVHAAVVEPNWLSESVWVGPPFKSLTLPLVARCGAKLHGSVHCPIVVMRMDSTLCPRCQRLTNLAALTDCYADREEAV